MIKVKMVKDDKYAKQGIFITPCFKGDICEVPEDIAKAFVSRGSAIYEKKEKVFETPKEPVLETQGNNLEGIEYKDLLKLAKDKGFVNDKKGRVSEETLKQFLIEVENE